MSGFSVRRISFQQRWEVWFVLIFAFCYYASYYRYGLNLGGEGGTAGVIALRLLEGQRPIADTFLGYNVLWFYPVGWLFQIFGPNYLVLKIYFFAICTTTALLATFLVRRTTDSSLLAAGTGLLVVLIPGMQFRNYMAFLGVLNMVTLSQAFVFVHNASWQRAAWRVAVGLALGVTYLIRIDIGLFITVLILTLVFVFPWSTELGPLRGLAFWAKGVVIIAVLVLALHLPVIWDAHRRGFQNQFLGQYGNWLRELQHRTIAILEKNSKQLPQPEVALSEQVRKNEVPQKVPIASSVAAATVPEKEGTAILSRPPLSDMFYARKSLFRAFAWAVYLPIPIIVLISIGIGIQWLAAAVARNYEACQGTLGVLVALGCALTLFPQYFFFRPDTPHLSEFMVPFTVAMVLACSQAIRAARAKGKFLAWGNAAILLCFCIPDMAAHVYNGLKRESSGSIAARKGHVVPFTASNGICVLVRTRDFPPLQGIYSTVIQHSNPTDWVVCYPYSPTINFMTNRRSYEFNLYVDNATRDKNFDAVTIHKLLYYQPAVVVIDNRAINKNEQSRFKNWAALTYEFIKTHYRLAGTYGLNEVYIRRKSGE